MFVSFRPVSSICFHVSFGGNLEGFWHRCAFALDLQCIFRALYHLKVAAFFPAIHGLRLEHCVKQSFIVNLFVSLKLSVCIWEECELLCAPG